MTREQTGRDLYVSEISPEVTEEDLRKLFTLCGKVRGIHMVTDPRGQFKGCAFVHMTTAAEGRDAITTLDGTRLVDRCISVTAALPRKGDAPVAVEITEKPTKPKRPRPKRRRR
jgi:RNA recognition motif-containing protein